MLLKHLCMSVQFCFDIVTRQKYKACFFDSDEEPVFLIFSNRHEMRSVDLSNHNYAALVSGLHNTVALDFYFEKKYIFWTDVADDKIFRGKLQGNGKISLIVLVHSPL